MADIDTSLITNKIEYTTTDDLEIEYYGESDEYLSYYKQHPFTSELDNVATSSINFLKKNNLLIWLGTGGTNPISMYDITRIFQYTFFNCTQLETIILPETVKTIHSSAFQGCTNLIDITIPQSVTYIQANAFDGCTSLQEITLPESLENLSTKAFFNCSSLKRIYCTASTPPGLGSYEHTNWYLYEENAEGRKIIVPSESVELYKTADGWSKYADDIIGVNEISEICYTTTDKNIVEVDSTMFEGIAGINENIYNTELDQGKIVFLGTVTSIKEDAFLEKGNLLSITIPSSVTTIESRAFNACTSLESVNIESNNVSISEEAFYGCTGIKLFEGFNSTEDGLCLVNNDGTLISFASGSDVTEYNIPDTITKIGKHAFKGSNLDTVAFEYVTYISAGAFSENNALKYVYCFTQIDGIIEIGEGAFPTEETNLIIYVPKGKLDIYQDSELWNKYNIKENLFAPYNKIICILKDGSVRTIEGNEKITSINNNTLSSYKTSLKSVYLPYALKEFGNYSFSGFSELQDIAIPNTIEKLPYQCFTECSNLTNIILNEGLSNIGDYVFIGCVNLKDLIIPSSVVSIGVEAFNNGTLYNLYCKPITPPETPETPETPSTKSIFGNGSTVDEREFNTNIYVPVGSLTKYRNYNGGNNEWFYYQESIIEIDYNSNDQPSIGFNIEEDDFKFGSTSNPYLNYTFNYTKIPEESLKDDNFFFYSDSYGSSLPNWVTIENIKSEKKFKITVKDDITELDRATPFYIFYKNNSYNDQNGYLEGDDLIGIKRISYITQYNPNFSDPAIDALVDSITFNNNDSSKGQISFNIQGNSSGEIISTNLKFDSDVDWIGNFNLEEIPTGSEGTGIVSFTVDQNSGYEDRTGTIYLRYNYESYQVWDEVTVTQSATPTEIIFTDSGTNEYTIYPGVEGYPEGLAITIPFTANYIKDNDEFKLENGEDTWYSAITDSKSIAVLVDPITDENSRTAIITLYLERDGVRKAEAYLTINQGGVTKLELLSDPEVTYTYTNNSGTIEYSLLNPIGSTPLSIESNVEWITDLVDNGNSTISYNITENTSDTSRTGIITVSYGSLSFTVTIIQEGYTDTPPTPSPVIKVQDAYKENYIGEEGGILQIGFTVTNSITNGAIIAESSNSWVEITETSESNIEIKVESNTGEERIGSVTVYYKNSDDNTVLSFDSFSVIQAAYTPNPPEEEEPEEPEEPDDSDYTLELISSSNLTLSYSESIEVIEYKLENPKDNLNIEVVAPSWVTDINIISEESKITFKVEANAGKSRSGYIKVSYGTLSFNVNISQSGSYSGTPVINVTSYSSSFSEKGGSGYINYNIGNPIPNYYLKANPSQSWITDVIVTNNQVLFNVTKNYSDYREGTISLVYDNITKNINIKQSSSATKYESIIYYTADQKIDVSSSVFDASIVTHEYSDKYNTGVITFSTLLKTIKSNGLSNKNGLRSIIIPEGVTLLESESFYNNSTLVSVELPSTLLEIQESSFGHCKSLKNITLPDSILEIGQFAFKFCESITNINIPNDVNYIAPGAFRGCASLSYFEGQYAKDNGRCVIKNNSLIAFAPASRSDYIIPNEAKSIYSYAFNSCNNLKTITIPENITSIHNDAFSDCNNLTKVYCKSLIPPSIGKNIFEIRKSGVATVNCLIYVDNSCVDVYKSKWAPYKDYIVSYNENEDNESVTLQDNEIWYKSIDGNPIQIYNTSSFGVNIISNTYKNGIGIIRFNNALHKIGDWAFSYCYNLLSVTIPNKVNTIGKNAFYHCCNLETVNFSPNTGVIEDEAFSGCISIKNIVFNTNLKVIGKEAFYYCINLNRINIPSEVTRIGDRAFAECLNLTGIGIYKIKLIGSEAFWGCLNLRTVNLRLSPYPSDISTSWDGSWGAFNKTSKHLEILVSNSSYNDYIISEGWKDYIKFIKPYV